MATDHKTVEDYLAAYTDEQRQLLQQVRAAIHRGVPDATEKVRYAMPAVMLGGRYAIHFAGWKNHIGLYAVPTMDEPLETAIAPYRNKDALAFAWSEPIPFDLIERVSAAIAALHPPTGT
ncbi:hypothetical protein BH09ACT9_BH09ACT9_54310 [soil metagenome]